jgi:hypothetical protein
VNRTAGRGAARLAVAFSVREAMRPREEVPIHPARLELPLLDSELCRHLPDSRRATRVRGGHERATRTRCTLQTPRLCGMILVPPEEGSDAVRSEQPRDEVVDKRLRVPRRSHVVGPPSPGQAPR